MGRFSTGVRVLSRRIAQIEYQRCSNQLPSALQEYALTGILPDNELLRKKIILIQATVRAMTETMPGPVED